VGRSEVGVNHLAQDGEQRYAVPTPPAPNLRERPPGVFGAVGEFLGDFLGTARRVSFGPFTLDGDTRQLLRGPDEQQVHLSPKAYELLSVLVATRPRAVAKGELHERLWPSTFVSEATLASLVGELRDALGERGRDALFIRTVHGFGYAFSGTAHEIGDREVTPIRHWIVCGGREKALAEGEHLIGRDPDVAIALNSPTVSRHHARIVIAGDATTLEDLGSKNGTYLRGQVLASPTRLADGDRIRIGAFELTFRTVTGIGSTETQA
jgi:DNA-binding winged helix-turn-helix (wHTH) protein